MRILGIDPGLTRCGVGVVEVGADRRVRFVFAGVIRSETSMPLAERLYALSQGIRAAISEHTPDAMAVERVFAQHNVSTVMGTAQASGIALALAAEHGIPVGLHTPSEVKAAVTGYGSADKAQVGAMVARLLHLDSPPSPADAADAVALAICHGWRSGGAAAVRGGASATLTPAQRAWRAAERRPARDVGQPAVSGSAP